MRNGLPILIGFLFVSGGALAEEPMKSGDQYRSRPVAIEAQVAPLGGPVGIVGVGLDIAPIPYFSLNGGVGLGLDSAQWSVAARPRIPITAMVAVQATAGYSRGDYTHLLQLNMAGSGESESFSGGSWVNADLGAEIRFGFGLVLRPFLGLSKLVACDKAVHENYGTWSAIPKDRWPWLPYAGVGVGYAIGAN